MLNRHKKANSKGAGSILLKLVTKWEINMMPG